MAVIPQGSSQAQGPGISAAVSLRFGLIASGKTFSKYGAGVRAEARGVGGTIDQEQPWTRGQASDSPSGQRLAAHSVSAAPSAPAGSWPSCLAGRIPHAGAVSPRGLWSRSVPGPLMASCPHLAASPGGPQGQAGTLSPLRSAWNSQDVPSPVSRSRQTQAGPDLGGCGVGLLLSGRQQRHAARRVCGSREGPG